MKKVINRKRYDTDTATLMGSDSFSHSRDFKHWTEALYRKSTGEYFLYGAGGPLTKYARAVGENEWYGGEKIMPLSVEAAQKWAEKHLSGEEYEAIFGTIEDTSDDKVQWTVHISPTLIEQVKRKAGERKVKLSEVVETALTAYFKAQDNQ